MTDLRFARVVGWLMIVSAIFGGMSMCAREVRARSTLKQRLYCQAIDVPIPICERLFP